MIKYILKRLGLAVVILLGVSLIIYVLVRSMPASFIEQKIAEIATKGDAAEIEELAQKMREQYGLTDDSPLGVLKGYVTWLGNLVRFDFGDSFKYQKPVVEVIRDNMGVSFAVSLIATVFEFLIAIPLGITAATHQYSMRDYVVTILVMIGISLPSFFVALLLQGSLADGLGWFYRAGSGNQAGGSGVLWSAIDLMKAYTLPILTVIIISIGGRMRMTRTNMLEVLNSDYIRTARAKGLSERKVIYKHAFRNTLIPIVTGLAGLLPTLFSGAIITEQMFDLPGIGNKAYQAMMVADIPFIMGYNMFLAMLSVLGVLLADLMYAVVDPRVKLA